MRCLSPAKLNLHLRVGPVGSDGFHPLNTWMVTVGLFDILDFLPDSPGVGITLSCDQPDLPKDDRNLIIRAARLLQTKTCGGAVAAAPAGVRVNVVKAIPMGGGLGGGSSNAATTLIALNELWAMELSPQRLAQLALQLGSDVPFFLNGPSARCTGRGERITPLAAPACRWAVLILPGFSMPTAAVYQRLDAMRDGALAAQCDDIFNHENVVDWQARLPALELLPLLMNDLEPPAFDIRPELAGLRDAAEDVSGRPVRMSGSGSTLFTLFDTKGEAESAQRKIQRLENHWRLSVKAAVVRLAP